MKRSSLKFIILFIFCSFGLILFTTHNSYADSPILDVDLSVSDEPLLGGQIKYLITIKNKGATLVEDKGYNLTITNTLPISLSFVNADPAPTFISEQSTGETVITWNNIADLEVDEDLKVELTASLDAGLSIGNVFINQATAAVNSVPDNSGSWASAQAQVLSQPQAVDIEMKAIQSTGDEQATGAGEYNATAAGRGAGADWLYQYQISVKNNNIGSSNDVIAEAILPAGVAYMGNPTIDPNPNGSSTAPKLKLNNNGSLELQWNLGALTPSQYSNPVKIEFDAAIPYEYRTKDDTSAKSTAFAGPMSGDIIPEDTVMPVDYEAKATYGGIPISDGSQSTPVDDSPVKVTAEYLTVSKSASPKTVGIGSTVTFNLDYYVSEYYTGTNVILTDILPDGMTYVEDSANLQPVAIEVNTPATGQTTLTWHIPFGDTTPGQSGAVTFKATVDPTYEAAPYSGQPVVSGDSLTNQVKLNNHWQDDVTSVRDGNGIPDDSEATVTTQMPIFSEKVWNKVSESWVNFANGFTGDTVLFRVSYDSASNVDGKGIIVRDFLPRGMTYVNNSARHSTNGSFSNGLNCDSAPTSPIVGSLNGLQYLEWRLCNVSAGSHWEATFEANIGKTPDVKPGWLVANFGKLSGYNTYNQAYSLRDVSNVDYVAPELELVKEASPSKNLLSGDSVVYTISVTNKGDAPAYNLSLVDTIPVNLLIPATGGNASPNNSSYSSVGDTTNGGGGAATWTTIARLDPGETQVYSYAATIPDGLPAGYAITNLASVSYNSRSDNTGDQTNATTNPDDLNTDEHTIYTRGITLNKSANIDQATIGDTVRWTLTGTVPPGFIAYWPVIEDTKLPKGFDYISGTTVINGAILDTTNYPEQPSDSGHRELYWFLETLDNRNQAETLEFSISFDTLVTGVNGNNPDRTYYNNNCCLENARNKAYIRWYETSAGGGNNRGEADTGGRRSGGAKYTVQIRQPNPNIVKSSTPANVVAGQITTHTLTIFGAGNDIAHEVVVEDLLPNGTTFVETVEQSVSYPFSPPPTPIFTDNNVSGTSGLKYSLDKLYVGSTWSIIYTTRVDESVAAGQTLTNTASITSYTSQPGNRADNNGDGLPDERIYTGPSSTTTQFTPDIAILKEQSNPGELTIGSTLIYTLTVPSTPIDATIYDAVLTDIIDSRLQIVDVINGAANGNTIDATFTSIEPNRQETIIIETVVPANSVGQDGDLIANSATLTHRHGQVTSNKVEQLLVAPALTIDKRVNKSIINEGDTVTYTLTVANVGSGLAKNLVITDELPANMSFISGSSKLNGEAVADPVDGVWNLTEALGSKSQHILTFQASVDTVQEGQTYTNLAIVAGQDSNNQQIPANNSNRIPADTDSDDQDSVAVFSHLDWKLADDTYIAYEDLKNVNRSDWDYNDFVVNINMQLGLTSAGDVGALRLEYQSLARGASLNHTFIHDIPLEGGGQAELIVLDGNADVVSQTNFIFADEPEFTIFQNTDEALTPDPVLTNTTLDQEKIMGHTAVLTIYLHDPSLNPADILPPLPWDPYIYVHGTNQEVHLVVPGHLDNMQMVNAELDAEAPLVGYDLPLAHVFEPGWQWPHESQGLWLGYPQYVKYIDSGYTALQNWYYEANAVNQWLWSLNDIPSAPSMMAASVEAAVTSRYFASPVVADLDGDGIAEIIIGNMLKNQIEIYNAQGQAKTGWPQSVGGNIKAAAAVADLDNDGDMEVLIGAGDGKLYAWHHTGQMVSGWPVTLDLDFRVLATPAVGHLDNDKKLDIVVPATNGKLYAFNANGSAKSGWPVSIGNIEEKFDSQVINSSPKLADLDGNGSLEIVIGSTDKKLYVFNSNGSLRWSFSAQDLILSTPAVADFDTSKDGLEIAFGSGDSYVYLLDKSGNRIWKKATGWTVRSSAKAADIDGNGDLEVLIGGDDDKLWAWHHNGDRVNAWPKAAQADIFSTPNMGDIDGDGDPEIVVGSDDNKIYAWHDDGTVVDGWPKTTNGQVKGSPALANLDDDAALEVVIGDFEGNLYIWNFSGTLPSTQADLSIVLTAPNRPTKVGEVMTYTAVVSNAGSLTANVVKVTGALPTGLKLVSASPNQGSCSETANLLTCNLGTLQNTASATITVNLQVNRPKPFAHWLQVASTQTDLNRANNKAQLTIQGFTGTTVDTTLDTTLTYTDTGTGRRIKVLVPRGAVTQSVTLRYTIAATRTSPTNSKLAGEAFHIDAYQGDSLLEDFTFGKGVTVTLHYSDDDVRGVDEEKLQLYYWNTDTSSWQEAACGEYTRNLTENWLSVPICHLTEFGLFGQADSIGSNQVFLPIVIRN